MHGTYHPLLVALSILVASLASYAALDLAGRVSAAAGRGRLAWLVGGSLAMGIGIWSMHFIGMLAFRLPVPIAYDVPLLLLSVGVAVAASFLALTVASRPSLGTAALLGAGLSMGTAIAGMHYVGMESMRMPARLGYDPVLVAASIGVAIGASLAALWLAFYFGSHGARPSHTGDLASRGFAQWQQVGAGGVMGLAIAGMHYTAMAAARFTPVAVAAPVPDDQVLATPALAAAVIIATLVVLLLALLGAMLDRRIKARLRVAEEHARLYAEAESARREAEAAAEQLQRQAVTLEQQMEAARALALERERVQAALRASERRFRGILERVRAVGVTLNTEGRVTFANDFLLELTGWTREEVLGADWFERFVPAGREVRPLFQHSISAGEIFPHYENEILTRSGERRLIAWDNTLLWDADGRVVGTASIGRDVTEERAALSALQQSEARFRATFEQAAIGMAHVALDGRWLRVNRRLGEIIGYTREELLGLTFQDITHPDDLEADLAYVRELLDGEIETYSMEKRYVRKDGSIAWINLTSSLVRRDDGSPDYFIAAVEDIDERRQAEEALKESEAKLGGIIGSAMDAIISVNARQEIVLFNAAAERIFGCPAAEALGTPVHRFLPERFRATHAAHICAFGETGTTTRSMGALRPLVALRADGTEFPIEATISQVAVGAQRLFTVILRDVTERRKAEEEREQLLTEERRLRAEEARLRSEAEATGFELVRLAAEAEAANKAKSEFLAMMSHELRTPLNAILGYLQLLTMGLPGPLTDGQRDMLERIGQNQRRLERLVSDVLDYAKLEAGELKLALRTVPAADLLKGLEDVILPQVRAKELELRYCTNCDAASVRVDPERVQQILLNLLSNAVKFTEAGGVIELSCESFERRVAMRVRDTGRGIPADKLESVFQPFVQVDKGLTRRAEGTGLGLAISRDLARAMGGDLTVTSALGDGSTFTLTLPRAHVAIHVA